MVDCLWCGMVLKLNAGCNICILLYRDVRNRLPVPDRLVGGGLVMVCILMVEGEFGLSKFAIK